MRDSAFAAQPFNGLGVSDRGLRPGRRFFVSERTVEPFATIREIADPYWLDYPVSEAEPGKKLRKNGMLAAPTGPHRSPSLDE